MHEGGGRAEGARKAVYPHSKRSRSEGSPQPRWLDSQTLEKGVKALLLRPRQKSWPIAQRSPDLTRSDVTQRGSRNCEV